MWAVLEAAFSKLSPDAILVSGDIAHDAKTQTYAQLDKELRAAFGKDVRYVCGNHDLIGPMCKAELDQSNLQLGNFTLVIADTHAEGETEGEFTQGDSLNLKDQMAAAGTEHLLIAGHHSPVEIGTPWLDKDRIRGTELLLDCLSQEPRVRGYVFGHIHQEFSYQFGDLPLFATPSTCFQFLPGSQSFSLDSRNAGFRHMRLHHDGRIETEVHRVSGVPKELDSVGGGD